MKTLRNILFTALLLCSVEASAQTYYYNTTKDFVYEDYTYHCNTGPGGYVTLYNANNIYTDSLTFNYKDGTRVHDTKILWGRIRLIEDDNWTKPKCIAIVNSAFSAQEKQRVGGEEFDISMTIDSETGHVIEVDFRFYKDEPFATIPVTTYRSIELALKQQVWFTPTSIGRQLQVLVCGWMHEVK
jgi:hypothetical protein